MPRNLTTGVFTRVSNSFSNPVYGTVIDPTDADSLFDDYDGGLTFNDSEPLMLVGSTSGALTILAPDTASGTITLPAGTTDFSATGGAGQVVKQATAGGPFTVGTVPASEIASGAALTKTDDTNVTLSLGGTPTTALLKATSITVGWTGTLAAGRLNSDVVQSVVNDTNVTGSISTQALTLSWSGQLAVSRGGTGVGSNTAYAVLCGGTTSTGAIQSIAGVGTSGQVLTSNGAGALPTFQSVSGTGTVTSVSAGVGTIFSTITSSGSIATGSDNRLSNLALAVSASAGALTIALKGANGSDPSASNSVDIDFRDATATTGTPSTLQVQAATSLVLPSSSTCGVSSSTAFKLWVLGFNDGGTFRLGVVNCLLGTPTAPTGVYPLGDNIISSSTNISSGSTSAGVIYTGTAVTSKPYRVLGYIEWNSTGITAGTWTTTNVSLVQIAGPGIKLPGSTAQEKYQFNASSTTVSSSTFQNSNVTLSITPTSAANIVKAFCLGVSESATQTNHCYTQIHQGSTAVGNIADIYTATGGELIDSVAMVSISAPQSTSSTTFVVKVKNSNNTNNVTFPFGASSSFIVTEIVA